MLFLNDRVNIAVTSNRYSYEINIYTKIHTIYPSIEVSPTTSFLWKYSVQLSLLS